MNENKYKPGAALCPECGSVIEYYYEKCPWCNHEFSGKQVLKIFAMLSETGIGAGDLHEEIKDAGDTVGKAMLPFCNEIFEKGSQGAKMTSLLVFREYGDLSDLPVDLMREGYKKSSNQVKVEIIKTLSKAGTREAAAALIVLKDFENDPEVFQAFSRKVSDEPEEKQQQEKVSMDERLQEEISMEMLSMEDIEMSSVPPSAPSGKTLPKPPPEAKKAPPPPPSSAKPEERKEVPSAEDIIPPMPDIQPPPGEGKSTASVTEKIPEKRSSALPIVLMGVGFIVTGAIVLIVLLAFDIKVPLGGTLKSKFTKQTHETQEGERESKTEAEEVKTVEEAPSGQKEETEVKASDDRTEGEQEAPESQEETEEGQEMDEGEETEEEEAGPVKVAAAPGQLGFSISVSSEHKEYPPSNMIDGNPKTVWQEERLKKPLGHKITLDFGKEVAMTSLTCITGFDDPEGDKGDMFPINNRLKKISIEFSDGSTRKLEFEDKRGKQTITIAPPVKTGKAVITILEVYRGSWFYDNAIAEIEVGGHE